MKQTPYAAVDGTIVLSAFHATTLRRYDGYEGSVFVAANGIVPSEFPEPDESKRDPHAAIYASAPNRGLEFLLDVWPQIRAQVPDATLRVYYSWVLTEQMMEKRSDLKAVMGPLLTKLKAKLEELKDQGVTYLGGVDHKTLHDAYRTSGVWTYPVGKSGFEEISCISAGKAQAAGCWPVIIPLGALEETCPFGTHVSDPAEYASAVVRCMTAKDLDRKTMRSWVLDNFSWDKAATQFLEHSRAKSKRITIYAGRFIRQFDGMGSADGKPLGGSEEAVIAMAHALASRGEEVVVYCPLPDGPPRGDVRHDKAMVQWRDVSTFVPAGPHGTLLAWRCPMFVPMLKGNGYPVILWLMDPEYGAYAWDYDEADDVVFLTESHKGIIKRKDGYDGGGSAVPISLPKLPELGSIRRDPKQVMWATSPDRGLLEFLKEVWPEVVKEVPDARLHIFYGLEPLELNGKKDLADAIRERINALGALVTYHGGVPDAELYEWYQRCGIFAYRSLGFEETQSLSLCKAQALGCYPVTNRAGCLGEVVDACGGQAVEDDRYVPCLIQTLKDRVTDEARNTMAEVARRNFSVEGMVEKMMKVIEGVRQ